MNSEFTPDIIIQIPRTEWGEAARSFALTMSDADLLTWCNKISQRDFGEDYNPETSPWLKHTRDCYIDFIVGSYLNLPEH